MKKLLFALIVTLALAVGCNGGGSGMPSTEMNVLLPPHIQRIMAEVNELAGAKVYVVDYRDDDHTLWLWLDNNTMDGPCDYVAVMGIIDKDKDKYKVLDMINKEVAAWVNSDDPCALGYIMYEDYLAEMQAYKDSLQPKDGI
jgi:hypothetical protein